LLGRTVSHYRIVRQVGSGGMGVAYLATAIPIAFQVNARTLIANTIESESH
jgi:hypothetical protein